MGEKIGAVAEILKKRFPNLSVVETINLACNIVETIDEAKK